ncbi:hypothetical protein BDA99DRAFT_605968 [Phascolomyces articulosus]|uniref:Heterokaryon incompatibility domain-containing protein n=1 Tax=Phascolomyces articulosus TaxID=60185 RepID=A0AAD5K7M7_9FUNG|nr:hypothetical protein BDA99DRAFT_605968 [Phascolomyces articulosus]
MGYIEYDSANQRSADAIIGTKEYRLALRPKVNYRPRWLIRTTDWKKVLGVEARNGYCVFSYCWSQSGETILQTDENGHIKPYTTGNIKNYIDRGRHKLTKVSKEPRKAKNLFQTHKKTIEIDATYEQFLQQLCKDFQIHYLWYDKVCIDQINEREKLANIKELYRIYGNANYLVAFVPEMKVRSPEDFDQVHEEHGSNARRIALGALYKSQWFGHSWTLMELMVSKHVLMVGRDLHFWQYHFNTTQL